MKRISALLITAFLFLSGMLWDVVPTGAVETSSSYEIEQLQGLGLLPESFSQTGTVTRGEFAKAVAQLFQDYILPQTEGQYFSDVDATADPKTADAVNFLASMGIVTGDGNVNFAPQDPISAVDAAVILVRILGYEVQAAENGGYPSGYLKTAVGLKLISGSGADPVDGQTLAVMLSRALESPMLVQTVWGEAFALKIDQDSTLLGTLLKIKIHTGRLEAIGLTALSQEYQTREGDLQVGGVNFQNTDTVKTELLGREVDVYYREKDGEKQTVLVLGTGTDRTLTVELDRVEKLDLAAGTLSYYDDGGQLRTAGFLAAPWVVYNGRPVSAQPQLGQVGSITCVSNGSGRYDGVILRSYETHLLEAVYEDGNKLQSKYALTPLPELDQVDQLLLYDQTGNTITPEELQAGDVLSVLRSKEGDYLEIWRNRDMFYGRIDGMQSGELAEYRLNVSAVSYRVTPEFFAWLQTRTTDSLLGVTTNFYLDRFGNLAGMAETSDRRQQIGYMTATEPATALGQPRIRVFTQDGVFVDYTLRSDMNYNQQGRKVGNRRACDWFAENQNTPQLIAYLTDNNGEIYRLDTPGGVDGGLYEIFNLTETKRYRSAQRTFGSKIMVRDDTLVFIVPKDLESANETYAYSTGGIELFVNGGQYSALTFYGQGEDALTADIVVYARVYGSGTYWDECPQLVEGFSTALNREGQAVERINVWMNGVQTFYDAAEGVTLSQARKHFNNLQNDPFPLGPGDVVRTARNSTQDAFETELIYSYATDTYYPTSNPYSKDATDGYRFGLGKVTQSQGNLIRVQYRETQEVEYFDISSSVVLVVEDTGRRIVVEKGDASDVTGADAQTDVFIYSPGNQPSYIYVLRH